MARTVGIGVQEFETLREQNLFYIDKTEFIRDWWERADAVTLITRPRRFGKTLNLHMVNCFFSASYVGRSDLFEGLKIWEHEEYHGLQGQFPVLMVSFADVKPANYEDAVYGICDGFKALFRRHSYLADSPRLSAGEREMVTRMGFEMSEQEAKYALRLLCELLYKHFGKKAIVLLDEYDTPVQEAYVGGFWDELVRFTRTLFNATLKTNPYLGRALLTGITRVSRESMFSDLNNLEVVTTTVGKYEADFGFTEEEVDAALQEFGYETKDEVKQWYDGFTFGKTSDIYNPWSICNYLDKGEFGAYWANTSSNALASKLIREGTSSLKERFGELLAGGSIWSSIDEAVVYGELGNTEESLWSLLLAAGYVKIIGERDGLYELNLTNYEARLSFEKMVHAWFAHANGAYNAFIRTLLAGDLEAMNAYMNRVALSLFSYFDTGKEPAESEPERFYHGFVLGLMVDLRNEYAIRSNRESGFGRYDVILSPKKSGFSPIIMEFKVHNPRKEASLEETVQAALAQIEEKHYTQELMDAGFADGQIRKYGFAFRGKEVLIG